MTRGFIGSNGRSYSASQRRAMFARLMNGGMPSGGYRVVSIGKPIHDKHRNRFVLPAALLAAPALSGVGASLGGAGMTGVSGAGASLSGSMVANSAAVGIGPMGAMNMGQSAVTEAAKVPGKVSDKVKGTIKGVREGVHEFGDMAMPAITPAAETVSEVAGTVVSDMGEPYMPTNSEFMTLGEDYNAFWSREGNDKSYIDVDNVRKLVKKQYPRADVNADIELLPPGEYTQFALKENPGREVEAATSNGFYSPVHDAAYLEKDPNKLNTLRAMIHEMAHDMSDDGVNDDGCQKKYMLNEGYADYVAKRIMTDELKIPEKIVKKTIGYPEEVAAVECLVKSNGRKKVDDAFLVKHSLDGLKTSGCEV